MSRGDPLFLGHMMRAAERIAEIVSRIDFTGFEQDWVVQNAVIRELEIFGEAAGKLSRSVTSSAPDIPWRQITGLRHKLIHDYFEVDIDVVWRTATENVPEAEPKIRALVERLERSGSGG